MVEKYQNAVFGNYRVIKQLGVGGMGSVHLAEHPLLRKRVALKIIHRELCRNRVLVARFVNEARALSKIGNPHIVDVLDFGEAPDGGYFIIMEYVEGTTLAKIVQNGPLANQRVMHIGMQIASGLAAAHSAGILHRDLKPDNVILTPTRQGEFVKVLDFGLAKAFGDGRSARITAVGLLMGTPHYMSPEACQSRSSIDHRADIYSLGVLMFQMATGRLPFYGASTSDNLLMHVNHPPPAPRAIVPTISVGLEQIILRCLGKSPHSRFSSMEGVIDALLDPDAYLMSSPPVMPTASGVPTRPPKANRHRVGYQKAATLLEMSPAELYEQRRHHTMVIGLPAGYKKLGNRRRLATLFAVVAGLFAVISAWLWVAGDGFISKADNTVGGRSNVEIIQTLVSPITTPDIATAGIASSLRKR